MSIKNYFQQKLRKRLGIPEINNCLAEILEKNSEIVQQLQDLAILGRSTAHPGVRLKTEYPVAIKSADHRFPRGSAKDNTRYPRFCYKSESLLGSKLRFLDLGCSGGGLVWDFLLRNHFAIGVEGSDFSLINQRAAWRVIPEHLFTCDVTKPFLLTSQESESPIKFDLISAWEVLEHIPASDLPRLFENVRNHISPNGLFVASVATFEDFDKDTGAVWHVTVKNQAWWENTIREHGFAVVRDLFAPADFPRGSGNGPKDWSAARNPELGFHLVARLAQ